MNGKNAVVTGSRKGLGAAIAVALAEAGANVTVAIRILELLAMRFAQPAARLSTSPEISRTPIPAPRFSKKLSQSLARSTFW